MSEPDEVVERWAQNIASWVVRDIQKELRSAVEKHGFKNTPMNPQMDERDAYLVLMEEVGEVAQTFTYDKQDGNVASRREDELIQVAAMATAMVVASRLRRDPFAK